MFIHETRVSDGVQKGHQIKSIKNQRRFHWQNVQAADHVLLTCCKHTRGLAGKDRPFNIYADEPFYSFLTQRGFVIPTRALLHLCSDVIITAVISVEPYLVDKGLHTALDKIYKNVDIKTSDIIIIQSE